MEIRGRETSFFSPFLWIVTRDLRFIAQGEGGKGEKRFFLLIPSSFFTFGGGGESGKGKGEKKLFSRIREKRGGMGGRKKSESIEIESRNVFTFFHVT